MRNEKSYAKALQLIWLPTGGHIGDAIMVMALLGEATEKSPQLRVQYVVRRNASAIAELARAYPAVTITPLPYAFLPAVKATLGLLAKKSIVIVPPARDVHPHIIKILALLFMVRGDLVIGFRDPVRDPTKWHPYTKFIIYNRTQRYIENLREALAIAALPTKSFGAPPQLEFISSLPVAFPFTGKPYFVIHAFAHMSTGKSMPLRRWKQLIQKLYAAYPTHGIVVTGADVDRAQAEELVANTDAWLAIDLPLEQVAGLIKNALLYIGIDTGPTHLAGVLSAPSVILAQQNEPLWLPDYNPNAVILWSKKDCVCDREDENCIIWEDGNPYRRCVYGITDESILEAVRAIL
jgi:ADP-heptose:LPS heptosyltransferase